MTDNTMENIDTNNSSYIDNKMSLYLPIIDAKLTDEDIKKIFLDKQIGIVSRIDFTFNLSGKKQAFIHFNNWINNTDNLILQHSLNQTKISKKAIKLNYDFNDTTKFLLLLVNNNPLTLSELSDNNEFLKKRVIELEAQLESILLSIPNTINTNIKRTRCV